MPKPPLAYRLLSIPDDATLHFGKNRKPVIDLRINRPVNTAGIKIRVLRTSDDAQWRRENTIRIGSLPIYSPMIFAEETRAKFADVDGRIRRPAEIAEIEVYGFVPMEDKVDALSQSAPDEKKGDEFLVF